MAIGKIGTTITGYVKKYKYVLLILAIGLLLMVIPFRDSADETIEDAEIIFTQTSEKSMDVTLAEILSKIDGAGRVQVLLTIARGEETVYQTDSGNTQISTVIVTDAQRAENGLIVRVNPPVYLGAIIVCQGADSPSVRLAVVEAVSAVTGLGADRISVLKMK